MLKKKISKGIAGIACAAVLIAAVSGTTVYARGYKASRADNDRTNRVTTDQQNGGLGTPGMDAQNVPSDSDIGQDLGGMMPGNMPGGMFGQQTNGEQHNGMPGQTETQNGNGTMPGEGFGQQTNGGQPNGTFGQTEGQNGSGTIPGDMFGQQTNGGQPNGMSGQNEGQNGSNTMSGTGFEQQINGNQPNGMSGQNERQNGNGTMTGEGFGQPTNSGQHNGMFGLTEGQNGNGTMPGEAFGQQTNGGQPDGMFGQSVTTGNADSALDITVSDVVSTAKDLSYSESGATTVVMTDTNNSVKISESGTYIVTGSCGDGNIVVKKGTTGVVLILRDLDLTSTTGAAVSINKGAEAKIVIEGTVNLTDNEDPDDENSSDADTADAFDGAVIKAKDGSNVYLTGTGTLNLNGSCKNGIKIGDEDTPCFVIDGSLTVNINAANDGINAGYDLTILSGNITINAGDDGIHADRILMVGSSDGSGPNIEIQSSYEGIEATIVDIFGGTGSVVSSDDGINAANSDGTYVGTLRYAVNITGGTWTVNAGGDGIDSNQDVNITGGSVTIRSGSNGGEAGIDYDGSCYIADGTLTNYSGIAVPDNMMGGMNGGMGGNMNSNMNGNMNGGFGGANNNAGNNVRR